MNPNSPNGPQPDDLRFFDALPDNYLVLSPDLVILAASDSYLRATGKKRPNLVGQPLFDLSPKTTSHVPDRDGGMSRSLENVLQTGLPDDIPLIRYDMPDTGGKLQEHYWKTTNLPVHSPDGKLAYIIHRTENISAQVIKEKQLEASLGKARILSEQMERLFHDIPAQIAIVRGPDLIYDYVNPQYNRELFPGRDVLGLPLVIALPEVEGQPIWDILQKVYQSGEPFIQNELLIPLAAYNAGPLNDHYFNIVYQPLRNETNEVYAILSFKYEVTTHVAARKKLEISEQQLQEANEQLTESVEKLQAIHEELSAANEEMTASNEELENTQDSLRRLNNELEQRIEERTQELAGSMEELQAANEELLVTNEELSQTQQLLEQTLSGLVESEQRFRNLIRDATIGIVLLTGPEMRVGIVNDAYGRLIERSVAELEGRLLFEVIPDAETYFRPIIESVLTKGEPVYLYDTPYLVYKNGQPIEGFLNVVYQPYREADGRVTGVMVLCQDVSEQVGARQKLEDKSRQLQAVHEELMASSSRLNMAIVATDLGTWDYQMITGELFWSVECRRIYGIGADEPVTMAAFEAHIHPDDRNRVEMEIGRCIATGSDGRYHITYRILRFDDGQTRWIQVQGTVHFNAEGTAERFVGTVLDITTMKQAEEESAKLAAIITSSDDAIVSKTLESVITSWNDSAERIFGYSSSEMIGETIYKLIPEDRHQEEPEILKRLKNGERVEHFETKRLTKDGRLIDVSVTVSPVRDPKGNIIGLSKVARDITAARHLLEQLEASETRFRFMLNAIPQQVWTATPDGALDYVNQVVCDDFGYNTEQIVGQGWQAFIHPDDLPACLEKWLNALRTGTEYVVEFRLKFRDGTYRWHLARAVPFAEGGQIKLWLGTNTNIDPQKMNEQRKDEFLSIASHELKTPLTSIKAYNQILQRIDDPEKLKPFIKKSADHIIRLERLIGDLLDVTKINANKITYVLEPVNIKTLLNESIESIQHGITSHEIILESAPDIEYTGDHLRLEQVIHNFLSNAVKYSPGGKKVLVNSKVDQGNIIVSVQDFGIGIARENLDRLFDRYYRVDNTAMRFEGLGLGLFISAEILRKHGGSFWIESEEGKGSTFYFRLPLEGVEKAAVTRTATFYRDQHLIINFNQTKKRLEVDWTGFQDLESVKHGCMLIWEFLRQNHSDRVVNDNTHVMGNWSEATDWVGNTWFPMMEQAGLKYFAHVFSPSTFSQLAAIKSIDIMAGIVTTQYFTEINLAKEWVDRQ